MASSDYATTPGRALLALRIAAVGTAVGTFAFLVIGDDLRLSNLFLAPDLVVCAVLLGGAASPRSLMLPVLLLGFGVGAGVFMTASADYLLQGRFGIGAAIGLLTSVIAAGFIVRLLRTGAR